jgi:hypothetical protein
MLGYELANPTQYVGISFGWFFVFHQGRS